MCLFRFSVNKQDFFPSSAHIHVRESSIHAMKPNPKYDRNPFCGMAGETCSYVYIYVFLSCF